VAPNRFYYVAGTFDGTAAKLYVNGVLEDSKLHPFALDVSTAHLQTDQA